MTEPTKVCSKCGEEKPLEAFPLANGARRAQCRKCRSAGSMASQKKNPEGLKASYRKYREKPQVAERQKAYLQDYLAKPAWKARRADLDEDRRAIARMNVYAVLYPQEFDQAGWRHVYETHTEG